MNNPLPTPRKQDRAITFLTQEEVQRLFSAIKTKRDQAIFAVAYRHASERPKSVRYSPLERNGKATSRKAGQANAICGLVRTTRVTLMQKGQRRHAAPKCCPENEGILLANSEMSVITLHNAVPSSALAGITHPN
jgi:hypothetical protein